MERAFHRLATSTASLYPTSHPCQVIITFIVRSGMRRRIGAFFILLLGASNDFHWLGGHYLLPKGQDVQVLRGVESEQTSKLLRVALSSCAELRQVRRGVIVQRAAFGWRSAFPFDRVRGSSG